MDKNSFQIMNCLNIVNPTGSPKETSILWATTLYYGDTWDDVKIENDFHIIMEYAKKNWKEISLFANSMSAYFSLIAYKDEKLQEVIFISPVLNMKKIIEIIC